jgi:hypothetical protein
MSDVRYVNIREYLLKHKFAPRQKMIDYAMGKDGRSIQAFNVISQTLTIPEVQYMAEQYHKTVLPIPIRSIEHFHQIEPLLVDRLKYFEQSPLATPRIIALVVSATIPPSRDYIVDRVIPGHMGAKGEGAFDYAPDQMEEIWWPESKEGHYVFAYKEKDAIAALAIINKHENYKENILKELQNINPKLYKAIKKIVGYIPPANAPLGA